MSNFQRVRRRTRKALQAFSSAIGLAHVGDVLSFARAPIDGVDRREPSAYLLAPPGGGNIGDSAMVESFIENTPGAVVLLVRSVTDFDLPEGLIGRTTIVAIPGLIYGDGREHRSAVREFRQLLLSAQSLSIVGADIMDGAYNIRASSRRAGAATLARSVGVDTRILGFSWNSSAEASSRRALRRASLAGARLLVRDPISAKRARKDGLVGVTEVADMVFAARSSSSVARDELLKTHTQPYVVVNASGLAGRSYDQLGNYSLVVRHFIALGYTVVLLPHVVRASANDAVACREIFDEVASPSAVLIDRVLSPAEVRGLCENSRLVVTGRMHLAIQSFWTGVPAITLSTQGKVEGLMELFETPDLCIEPSPGLAEIIIPLIDQVLRDDREIRAKITRHLPRVKRLAMANFAQVSFVASDEIGELGRK